MKKLFEILILIFITVVVNSSAIDRRGTQFLTESSYLVFPLPYSLAGIGKGAMITALAGNINDTYIDAFIVGIAGDVEGAVIAVEDIHILPKFLILDLMSQYLSKAVVNNYDERGMHTSRDDYNLIEVDKVLTNHAKLTLSFFDRRLELYGMFDQQKARIISISDSDGVLLSDMRNDPYISEAQSRRLGLEIDYTDDKLNPKKGIRFNAEYISSPPQSDSDPTYFTIDKSLTFYIPVSKPVTLAFNAFLSDAYVIKSGETDPNVIRADLNMGCGTDTECLKVEENMVNTAIAANTNGTATALGGERRLRSFPANRYNGAHSLYYATELRWNLSEEVRPFDFGIWKDVATGLQIAAFYEVGSVSEKFNELSDVSKVSYGGGLRLVSASGYVYRADYANGDEGSELTVMFSYPW